MSQTAFAAQRILIRAPNWIGDEVMAFPFYRGLAKLFPQAEFSLLGVPSVLALAPPIPLIRQIPLQRGGGLFGWLGQALALRKQRFDLAITLTASLSSALLLRAAGIPKRFGFAEPAARWLLTDPVVWAGRSSGKHKAQLYLDLLAPLGGSTGAFEILPVARKTKRQIVLAPGASIALREWPYFRELTTELRQRFPEHALIVVGSDADRNWGALSELGAENRIGKTTLLELSALCAESELVVANDSGVAHVAASLGGAPTVVLFGPGDPNYIRPLGPRVLDALAPGVLCSPCESAHCRAPYGYQKCLRDLTLEAVLAQITAVLSPL